MEPTVKASLLWGLVGALTYLVLIQAYHLLGGEFVGIGVMASVAVFVGVLTTITSHVVRPHARKKGRTRQ